MLTLLRSSIDNLTTGFGVPDNDAISLVGRALFTRFLADRGLLPESFFSGARDEASELFDNADDAARTSQWLDVTFNGDFLPIDAGLFASLPAGGYKILGDILHHAPGGQLSIKWEQKWENLDFAHIPVGVLSQAYEHYLRAHAPAKQRKEGGYYTPRIIAEMMVRGAFHALRRDGVAHQARVLDAAVGAGVFLITAFRELVSERWRHDGARPDTNTLREILYGQITGFDINESALRFAALGLYLQTIELDPNPEPVEKLRFENLRGTVLYNVGEENGTLPSRGLGSLGSRVGKAHRGRYDLVIGNPPWASGTGLPDWEQVVGRVAQIAQERNPQARPPKLPNEVLDLPFVWRAMEWSKPGGQIALALHARLLFQQGDGMSEAQIAQERNPQARPPKLPNEVLDLPFVWRAMEWSKPGGQIALALHARLLFQQGDGMSEARSSLFSALNVTGIVNGSEIRSTKVWPKISAPFCLLFARNESPPPSAGFRFVSPRLEDRLNGAGGLRVDASNAEMIASEQVTHRAEILKVLFRGSPLDLEVFDRLQSRELETFEDFWRRCFNAFRGRPRFAGNGYQKLRKSSKKKKRGDGDPGVSATHLWNLSELTSDAMRSLLVDVTRLVPFRLRRVHRTRCRKLYRGHLLLAHQSPPAQAGRIRVAVAEGDLIFNETYYGYSAKEHLEGKRLVRYLALLLGSKLVLWYALITSGKFGVEREVVEKFIIDSIPIPSFEDLKRTDLEQIDELFEALVREDTETTWVRVDDWVVSLFGLRGRDLQVITDTLRFNLPFADNRRAAQSAPSGPEVASFCSTLSSEIKPWAKRAGKKIHVVPVRLPAVSPWGIVQVGAASRSSQLTANQDWAEIVREADRLAATEITLPDSEAGWLWLARLNQARYWSRSQAQLVACRIVWEHVDFLSGL